jgi:hypothetical protein
MMSAIERGAWIGMGKALRIPQMATAMALALVLLSLLVASASALLVSTIGQTGRGDQRLRYPTAVAPGPNGVVYVLDTSGTLPDPKVLIKQYGPSGVFVRAWRVASQSDIYYLAVDPSGNAYVSVPADNKVLKYSSAGQLLLELGTAGSAAGQLKSPGGLALDPGGDLLVIDGGNGRIVEFRPDGTFLKKMQYTIDPHVFSNSFDGITADPTGTVYVADRQGIVQLDPSGAIARRIVQKGADAAQVDHIRQLITDRSGAIYAVQEQRVQKFSADGQFLGAVAGSHSVQWGSGAVAVDGSIYVSQFDIFNRGLLKFAPITGTDFVSPKVRRLAISPSRLRFSRRALRHLRVRFELSEHCQYVRFMLFRRVGNRRSPHGRFVHDFTLGEIEGHTGRNTIRLGRTPTRSIEIRSPGVYRLAIDARDDAGNEGARVRAKFKVARK